MKINTMPCKRLFLIIFGIWLMAFVNQSLLHADSWQCQALPIADIIKNNHQISYMPCSPAIPFEYERLPLADDHYLHPYKGIFHETFILTIPQGSVFGLDGWILVEDALIHELIWQNVYLSKYTLQEVKKNPLNVKNGRLAIIAQTGYTYYYHWIVEVLGRLALLEMQGIEYDFLYVPTRAPFMKETLQLWGIDPLKIIEASDDFILTADTLIVPSLVSSVRVEGCPRLVHYIPSHIVDYVRKKLLHAIEQQEYTGQFSKRVFISRQDASARRITNEDEVFSLFEAQGFQRYYLTTMSVIEQIMLFKNAEIIVSSLGSGLTNIMFCNPEVQIIELYQARRDCTIWNLSQMLGLHMHHKCIKTMEFIDQNEGQYDTIIPLDVIKEVIAALS